jgi:hypothetical protein
MALIKAITNDLGITTNYHKVGRVSLTEVSGRKEGTYISFDVESYVSKDYRDQNKPAGISNFRFEITLEEEESMGIRALCYTKLKETEAWQDAEDC